MKVRSSVCSLFALLLFEASALAAVPCAAIQSQPEKWVTTNVDALVRAAYRAYESDNAQVEYARTLDGISGALHECKLDRDITFLSRYQQFVDYVKVLSFERQPEHELGFAVTDRQYFAETRKYVEIPDFLLATKFLRAVSGSETLAEAKSILTELNKTRAPSEQLIFLSYKSRHLGTPDNDNSFWRLLIVVPGDNLAGIPEKWVQFGLPDPGSRMIVRNVSVVSALADAAGATNVYFKDSFRTFRRDGSITIKGRWELGQGDDNCVQCHKSGILPIFPVAGSVSRDEQAALRLVNQRFLNYGRPRFDKYLDVTKLGPGLGSSGAAELHRRFGVGFAKSDVARGMICSQCHQPDKLGSLNWPMDRVVIGSFIRGGQMPFGIGLRKAERSKLYQKLIEDYFATDDDKPGVLKAWLLGRRREKQEGETRGWGDGATRRQGN